MKRIVVLLMALVMALFFAACGSKGPKIEDIAYKQWVVGISKEGVLYYFVFNTVDEQRAFFSYGEIGNDDNTMFTGDWKLKDDTVVFLLDKYEEEVIFKCVYDEEDKLTLHLELDDYKLIFYDFDSYANYFENYNK